MLSSLSLLPGQSLGTMGSGMGQTRQLVKSLSGSPGHLMEVQVSRKKGIGVPKGAYL